MFFFPLCHRLITKMDKITGSKIPFMSEYPEFGRLDSLDIYADENRDGNSIIPYYTEKETMFYAQWRQLCILDAHSFRRKTSSVVKIKGRM